MSCFRSRNSSGKWHRGSNPSRSANESGCRGNLRRTARNSRDRARKCDIDRAVVGTVIASMGPRSIERGNSCEVGEHIRTEHSFNGERHLPVICDGAVPGVAPVTGTPFSVRSSFIAPRSPRTPGVDLALRPTAAKSNPDTAVLRRGASSGAPKCIRGRCRELRASPGQQSSIARSPPTEPGRLFGRALRPRNEGPTSDSWRRRVRPCDTSGSYREGSTFLTGRSCAFALG
jgi:hypothetical protein